MQFVFQCSTVDHCVKRLHRLVVRTSRCGRDNPGSTPGVDIRSGVIFVSSVVFVELPRDSHTVARGNETVCLSADGIACLPRDSLAEWSKALASGASPQGRGFEPHSCHARLPLA